MIPYILRAGSTIDAGFITKTWCKEAKSTQLGVALGAAYAREHPVLAWKWLASHRTKVTVACDVEDEEVILGYMVEADINGEEPLVHYLYTREDVRCFGIAHTLFDSRQKVDERRTFYTHKFTDQAMRMYVPEGWAFNPYMFLCGP